MADIRIIPAAGAINVTGSADFRGDSASTVLFVSGSGNVGVGTSNPISKLHVAGAVKATATTGHVLGTSTDTGRALSILNSGLAHGESYSMALGYANSNNNQAEITYYLSATGSTSNRLSLGLYNSSDTLNVVGNGRVGIGTVSPTAGYKLDVAGSVLAQVASGNVSFVVATNNANGAVNAIAGSGLEIATDGTNKNILFRTGVSTRMVISSAGAIKFNNYGAGTNTGTAAYSLAVDSSGNIIETTNTSLTGTGTTNYVTKWSGANSLTDSIIYNSGGSIGIGLTNPSHILTIYGSNAATVYQTAGTGTGPSTGFYVGHTNDISYVWNYQAYPLVFATNNTERIRILSGGNVGIGITNPSYALHINGGAASRSDVQVTYNALGTTNADGAQFGIQSAGAYIWNFENSAIYFGTNNSRRVDIDAGGNVGIGITSPYAPLHVRITGIPPTSGQQGFFGSMVLAGDAGQWNRLRFDTAATGSWGVAVNPDRKFVISRLDSSFSGYPDDSNFVIDTNGRIGIGTTSPVMYGGNGMEIASSGQTGIRLSSSTTGKVEIGADSVGGYIQTALAGNNLRFYTGNANPEVMVMTSGGNVGIGYATPNQKLVVAGNIAVSASNSTGAVWFGTGQNIGLYRDNTYDLVLTQQEASGNPVYVAGAGDVIVSIDSNDNETTRKFIVGSNAVKASNELFSVNESGNVYISNDLNVTGKITAREFHTTFVSASIIYQSGSTKFGDSADDIHHFTGNVGIGSTAPGYPLDVNGNVRAGRIITTGLYGPSTTGNIPIWQYDAGNPGYGIIYGEGTPDTLRIDVSGNALTGTPDFLVGENYAQINGNTVWHAGNDGAGSGLDADTLDGNHGSYYTPAYINQTSGDHDMHAWNKIHAVYSDNSGGSTYIVVQTNVPQDNYSMGGFELIFENDYDITTEGGTLKIYGYWNPESNGGFTGFKYTTDNPYLAPTVQVARNTTTGKTAFLISGESRNYSQLIAKDLWLGYSATSADVTWGDSWSIFEQADTTGFTNLDTLTNASSWWYAGNDGAGSGLDADLLDGQHGSYYTNASNIDSGTLSNSRLPSAINVTSVTASFKGNLDGNAATATTATNVAWSGVSAGYRENYDLGFRPADNTSSYAGFKFGTPGNDANAGYFLVRGGADNDVYTQNGITLVADAGWLTLAQRTTAAKGIRFMTGTTSTTRMSIFTDGTIGIGTSDALNNMLLVAGSHPSGYSILGIRPGADQVATLGFYNTSNVRKGLLYTNASFFSLESDNIPIAIEPGAANVGIGVTTPGYKLQINGTTAGFSTIGALDNVRTGVAHYDTTAQAAGVGGQLVLGYKYTDAGDYTEGAIIKMYKENSVSGEYGSGINFQVRNTGANLSTKVTITPGGSVGIGVTNPINKLEVRNGGSSPGYSGNDVVFSNAYGKSAFYHDNGGYVYWYSDLAITFYPGSSRSVTFNTGGNVGIGVPNPEYLLDLGTLNEENSTDKIRFNASNGPAGGGGGPGAATGGGTSQGSGIIWKPNYSGYSKRSAGILQIAEGNYFRSGLAFYVNNVADNTTDWSEALRISSNGNIGIGITNPSAKFYVNNSGGTGNPFYVDAGNPAGATTLFEHTGANTPVPFRLRKSGYSGAAGTFGILYLHMNDNTNGNASNLFFTLNDSAGNEHEYAGLGTVIRSNTNGTEQGDLLFFTSDNGTTRAEKMRITSAGNVGINTTSPSSGRLQVDGGASGIPLFVKGGTSGWSIFERNSKQLYINANYSDLNLYAQISPATVSNIGLSLSARETVEDLYLTTAGNVGIGKTTPGFKLDVSGTAYVSDDLLVGATNATSWHRVSIATGGFIAQSGNKGIGVYRDATDANTEFFSYDYGVGNYLPLNIRTSTLTISNSGGSTMIYHNGTNVGIGSTSVAYKLDVAGTIRATGDVIAYSDRRVKENIVTLENSLDLVTKLRGVEYNKIGEEDKKIGVIAQEVLEVLPQVVQQDDQGNYSVAYGNMAGLFIEAIKQQQTRIETLEDRISVLEELLRQKL